MAIETLGERSREALRNVLDDENRRRIRRHLLKYFADRFRASGRRTDDDDPAMVILPERRNGRR